VHRLPRVPRQDRCWQEAVEENVVDWLLGKRQAQVKKDAREAREALEKATNVVVCAGCSRPTRRKQNQVMVHLSPKSMLTIDEVPAAQANDASAAQANGVPTSQGDIEPATELTVFLTEGSPQMARMHSRRRKHGCFATRSASRGGEQGHCARPAEPFCLRAGYFNAPGAEGHALRVSRRVVAGTWKLSTDKACANLRKYDRKTFPSEQVTAANGHFKIAELLSYFGGY
jgi:hypothetical protein